MIKLMSRRIARYRDLWVRLLKLVPVGDRHAARIRWEAPADWLAADEPVR